MLAASLRFIMLVEAVNFAHAGFMGIGAYISTVFMMQFGFPFWITVLIGGIASAFFALIFGLITLRLKGAYFFLVSFALCEIIRIAFSSYWVEIFGGVTGISGIPPPNPVFGLQFKPGSMSLFYLVATISILTVLGLYSVEKGYWGKIFKSISESDVLAESIGINIMKYKVIAFAIGCFIAGIAGSLYASFNGLITAHDFTYKLSLFLVVCVVFGGRDHILGTILGVMMLVIMAEATRVTTSFEPIIWGLSLITVLLFAPQGLLGFAVRFRK